MTLTLHKIKYVSDFKYVSGIKYVSGMVRLTVFQTLKRNISVSLKVFMLMKRN